MLRQLLTLLAVLSGLTATVAPAHALDTGVHAIELTQDAASCTAQVSILEEAAPGVLQQPHDPRQNFCPAPVIVVITPTVMLKADRARE